MGMIRTITDNITRKDNNELKNEDNKQDNECNIMSITMKFAQFPSGADFGKPLQTRQAE